MTACQHFPAAHDSENESPCVDSHASCTLECTEALTCQTGLSMYSASDPPEQSSITRWISFASMLKGPSNTFAAGTPSRELLNPMSPKPQPSKPNP